MSQRYQGGILGVGFNPLQAPNAPTIGTATAGDASATVTFTAPANVGGSAITSYVVQSTPGGISAVGSSSPITVSGLTNGTAYTFRVTALNSYGPSPASSASNSVTPAAITSSTYDTPGTYTWVVPAGVTSVSVVVVGAGGYRAGVYLGNSGGGGGGALAYRNNITVVPGSSYAVVVGAPPNGGNGGPSSFSAPSGTTTAGGGGGSGFCSTDPSGGAGGTPSGTYDGGGNGGSGGSYTLGYGVGGGGGAGGYTGSGGVGGSNTSAGSSGSGGGGGGGGGVAAAGTATVGGGVGLLGAGSSGAGSSSNGSPGSNGSGKQYGGGGTGWNGNFSALGGNGAVRIIWPGTTRAFPSTNTGNL